VSIDHASHYLSESGICCPLMVANWWVWEKQELRSGQDAGNSNATTKQMSARVYKRSQQRMNRKLQIRQQLECL
jgi:hypothetical protein